jgi:hypothetical protein
MNSFIRFLALVLVVTPQLFGGRGQSPNMVGRWKVEFIFLGTESHELEFDAKASGEGTFLILDARSNLLPPAEPTKASWKRLNSNQVTFSGEIEFPIGNVGRNPGILVFKGRLESQTSISGGVVFFAQGQNPSDPKAVPAKTGKFTAQRVVAAGAGSLRLRVLAVSVKQESPPRRERSDIQVSTLDVPINAFGALHLADAQPSSPEASALPSVHPRYHESGCRLRQASGCVPQVL